MKRRLLRGLLSAIGIWLGVEGVFWILHHARVEQPLATADRIEVRAEGGPVREIRITDPAAIARVSAFAERRRGGWAKSWHTAPVTQVHAIFYRQGEVVGWFASGVNFLQAPSTDGGVAAMRWASPAELEALNRLLGVPPGSHLIRH